MSLAMVHAVLLALPVGSAVQVAFANYGLLLGAFKEAIGVDYAGACAYALIAGEVGAGWLLGEAVGAGHVLPLKRWHWTARAALALVALAGLGAMAYSELWAAGIRDAAFLDAARSKADLQGAGYAPPQVPGHGQQVLALALPVMLATLAIALEPMVHALRVILSRSVALGLHGTALVLGTPVTSKGGKR